MSTDEIRKWIEQEQQYSPTLCRLSLVEVIHVAVCMTNILKFYYEGYPLGSFLTAVVHNNFINACCLADDINVRALPLYARFLYNKVPSGYMQKAWGDKEKEETNESKSV